MARQTSSMQPSGMIQRFRPGSEAAPTSGSRDYLGATSRLVSSFSKLRRKTLSQILPRLFLEWGSARSVPSEQVLLELTRALLSARGEASGVAIAQDLLALYAPCTLQEKGAFFASLGNELGPDRSAIEGAWKLYQTKGDAHLLQLSRSVEAPRQELFRRLNLAPGGTEALVAMRADLLRSAKAGDRRILLVDADLRHVLESWFNRGFLTMRRIDWSSSARLLDKVIRYEAVHHIRDWDDLRNRLDPPDRRCYAFFHPAMPEDPLIFVEVALTKGLPDNIQTILRDGRKPDSSIEADTALFYSINNCQAGLRGISFGHFLIKQVASDLRVELPNLVRFATLSPMPGFRVWLEQTGAFAGIAEQRFQGEEGDGLRDALLRQAADYLINAKDPRGLPLDPVARFHLGNGARLERVNWAADISEKGLHESEGMMVNYLYDLRRIEENHEAFAECGAIAVAQQVRRLARAARKAGQIARD